MKKTIAKLLGVIIAVSTVTPVSVVNKAEAAEGIIAFPGATGAGRFATGGRGGEVVHVTNLNDSGPGSLREAVSKSNRIVVFDVSGTIELSGPIIINNNTTVAGQTAPGGSGVTLKNYKMAFGGDNIICRFISSRPGPYKSTSSGNDGWGGAKGSNSIVDHCSISWASDEQWGLYSNNKFYTVQYSVIGPADSWGGHSKGVHGFGLMMGNGALTFDHNLLAHNVSRNFRGKVTGTETADFTNNVIYNWAYQTAYGTIGHLNYVGNTLKAGNGTVSGFNYVNLDSTTKPENFSIYLAGNRMLNKDNSVRADLTYNNWAGIKYKDGIGKNEANTKSDSAFQTISNGVNVSTALTAESAEAAYEHVLDYAGNGISPDLRTDVDKQVAYETRTGTGNFSGSSPYSDADSTQKADIDKYHIQCGTEFKYPDAVLSKTITDTDNDGMPDSWELERGLDPNDPSDTNGDYCGQGYTNIEYYINDLTVNAFPAGVVTVSPKAEKVPDISAFETIEAENYSTQSGVQCEDCSEGGQNVGYIENGDYIMFQNVNFEDGARNCTVRVASSETGGNIEFYLDNLNSVPVASCEVKGTGNWQEWTDIKFSTGNITGKHNLYLKFTGGEGFLLNINNFVFGRDVYFEKGVLINGLIVKDTENGSDWSVEKAPAVNSAVFGDRDFTFTEFPAELNGSHMIKTACDSKNINSDLAEFVLGADADIYVAFDSRVENIPAWLTEYIKTDMTASTSNDVVFDIYKMSAETGSVINLGTNGQSAYCVNYDVFVKEKSSEAVEPEKISGDINSDGKIATTDLLMLQQFMLGISEPTEEQYSASDINKDKTVNILDFIMLKSMLLQ